MSDIVTEARQELEDEFNALAPYNEQVNTSIKARLVDEVERLQARVKELEGQRKLQGTPDERRDAWIRAGDTYRKQQAGDTRRDAWIRAGDTYRKQQAGDTQ